MRHALITPLQVARSDNSGGVMCGLAATHFRLFTAIPITISIVRVRLASAFTPFLPKTDPLTTNLTYMVSLVTGQKKVYLFHPDCREHLYISGTPPYTNTSKMRSPPAFASFQRYPEFRKAWFEARTASCTIQSGSTLLIPEGWWHSVETVGSEGSISVNHWFR